MKVNPEKYLKTKDDGQNSRRKNASGFRVSSGLLRYCGTPLFQAVLEAPYTVSIVIAPRVSPFSAK
jgi:hypothetical protein